MLLLYAPCIKLGWTLPIAKYKELLFRGCILVSKLLMQGYYSRKLQTTFREFNGLHTDLVHKLDTSVSHMLKSLFTNCYIWLFFSYFELIVQGATCGTGNAHSFLNTWFHSLCGVHDFTKVHLQCFNLTGKYLYSSLIVQCVVQSIYYMT